MRAPRSVRSAEALGRVRLSHSFYMRDFLHSEIGNVHGIPNLPDDPELAIAAGSRLCEELLEPLQATFGRLSIRSAFRSGTLNAFGNAHFHNCASNQRNYARHIWDRRDASGMMGAMACIAIPWFADQVAAGMRWQAMAWWVHDHLPYSQMQFFPKLGAFNIGWQEQPRREIYSYASPRGYLTRPGMPNHAGDHQGLYPGFPALQAATR
ncbi:MAG: hypothetical protein JO001_12955 [Alphaproteobacteria bacterium]|nr:hypothetical protein [Alphaproteobacteria bacterium]